MPAIVGGGGAGVGVTVELSEMRAPASDGYAVIGDGAGAPQEVQILTGVAGTLRHEVGGIEADISAITTDDFIVGTGAGTAAVRTAAQARAHLSLEVGTDVQAYDATLASIAALGTAGDVMAYTTGVDTWAETSLTAFARTILDDANGAAVRTTIGAGTGSGDLLAANNLSDVANAATSATNLGLGTGDTVQLDVLGLGLPAVAGTRLTLPSENDAVTPTLAWGDGDSGMYEISDDTLAFAFVTAKRWEMTANAFYSSDAAAAAYINQGGATATVCAFCFRGDGNTGIGTAGADQLSHIAGGVEQMRLQVSGNHVINSLLDAATGNEVGLTLNYTVNKATSGNDTGLVIDQTDTLSPGTSLLADFKVGGASKASIDNTGALTLAVDLAVTNGGTGVSTFGGTNTLLYTTAADTLASLATANDGVLITSGAGVPSISSTLPNATQDNITRLGTVTVGVWNGTDVAVADGGTGLSSTTAYAVLCGGTTGTGALQSIAALGASGEVLTSNGAGALPTMQALPTASVTVSGIAELATTAETDTGTDTARVVTPDGLAGSVYGTKVVSVKAVDDTTALTTGDGKLRWTVPEEFNGMILVTVGAHVYTNSTSGTPTFQIHNETDTVDMLSTLLTIDINEPDSDTAATPAVINAANDDVATADVIRFDCDVAGTGTAGMEIRMGFRTP